jgi:hypothetical protein
MAAEGIIPVKSTNPVVATAKPAAPPYTIALVAASAPPLTVTDPA